LAEVEWPPVVEAVPRRSVTDGVPKGKGGPRDRPLGQRRPWWVHRISYPMFSDDLTADLEAQDPAV